MRAAVIGAGSSPDNPGVDTGFAMGHVHARQYESINGCEIVAVVDLDPENARVFAERFGLGDEQVYADLQAMLQDARPEMVSVCTPPPTHADIVTRVAVSRVPDAIYCEKPMATTWRDAQLMAHTTRQRDVTLLFNHQRRYADIVMDAKQRLDDGVIGDLCRVEYVWGDFFDNGSHAVDLCNYFNDDHAADWVIGQLDYRREDIRFGVHQENQMSATWRYENGVYGQCQTGPGADLLHGDIRLHGTQGVLDVALDRTTGGVWLAQQTPDGWEPLTEYTGGPGAEVSRHDRAIREAVRAVSRGEATHLRAENALTATEIIFAGYESARRHGRVDLPLKTDDNAFEALLDDGALQPASPDRGRDD